MSKFKNAFVESYEQEQRQKNLKEKNNISDENVIVVEKNNVFKFTVNLLIRIIKCFATVLLLFLACIGLYALLNPTMRTALSVAITDLITLIKNLIN